jgi:hypothetical protein
LRRPPSEAFGERRRFGRFGRGDGLGARSSRTSMNLVITRLFDGLTLYV